MLLESWDISLNNIYISYMYFVTLWRSQGSWNAKEDEQGKKWWEGAAPVQIGIIERLHIPFFWELPSVQICMWSPVMLLLWVFLCTLPNSPVTGFYFWVQDLWTFKTWVLLEYLERLHSSSERLLILFTPTVDHALSDCFMKVQQQKEGFYQVSMTRIV